MYLITSLCGCLSVCVLSLGKNWPGRRTRNNFLTLFGLKACKHVVKFYAQYRTSTTFRRLAQIINDPLMQYACAFICWVLHHKIIIIWTRYFVRIVAYYNWYTRTRTRTHTHTHTHTHTRTHTHTHTHAHAHTHTQTHTHTHTHTHKHTHTHTYLVFPLPDGPSIALIPVLNIPL